MAKIKKRYRRLFTIAKKMQDPFINWVHGLPFAIKISIGIICGILGIFGMTNPLVPAWFFLPVAGQILLSQRKSIARATVDFKQKTVRFVSRKRNKIIRKTKKLGNCSLYSQCLYRQRLHNLLHIND